MTTDEAFKGQFEAKKAHGTEIAVTWLMKNWAFCHYCGKEMVWRGYSIDRYDRTTGKKTNLWTYKCITRHESVYGVHDAADDFEVISLHQPKPLPPDPKVTAALRRLDG